MGMCWYCWNCHCCMVISRWQMQIVDVTLSPRANSENKTLRKVFIRDFSPFFFFLKCQYQSLFISRWLFSGCAACSSRAGYFLTKPESLICFELRESFQAQTINNTERSIVPLIMFTSEARGCKWTGIYPILWSVVHLINVSCFYMVKPNNNCHKYLLFTDCFTSLNTAVVFFILPSLPSF